MTHVLGCVAIKLGGCRLPLLAGQDHRSFEQTDSKQHFSAVPFRRDASAFAQPRQQNVLNPKAPAFVSTQSFSKATHDQVAVTAPEPQSMHNSSQQPRASLTNLPNINTKPAAYMPPVHTEKTASKDQQQQHANQFESSFRSPPISVPHVEPSQVAACGTDLMQTLRGDNTTVMPHSISTLKADLSWLTAGEQRL